MRPSRFRNSRAVGSLYAGNAGMIASERRVSTAKHERLIAQGSRAVELGAEPVHAPRKRATTGASASIPGQKAVM